MKKPALFQAAKYVLSAGILVLAVACASPAKESDEPTEEVADSTLTEEPTTPESPVSETDTIDPEEGVDDEDSTYTGGEIEVSDPEDPTHVVVLNPGEYQAGVFADSLTMEQTYAPMLQPIASLKTSDPKTYWFIVSWLNTAYKTPSWDGYDENYKAWKSERLTAGIDCSGFARVMSDRIFGNQVRGSSSGIYAKQVDKIDKPNLQKGDLVFFHNPYVESTRIVHVGVYLQDNLFVHATSTKSASKGRGLMINSLDEQRWSSALVGGGRVKAN